jgi:hypothetical protein
MLSSVYTRAQSLERAREAREHHAFVNFLKSSFACTLAASSELSKLAEPMATVKPSGDHARFRYSCTRGRVSVGLAALWRTSHTRKERSLSPANVTRRCGVEGSQRTY